MMNHHELTASAQRRLIESLERFGNTLSIKHKTALYILCDSFTRVATNQLQGRWAFGLPTGTGKTRAIIEWATAVHMHNAPFSLAVSASKIEALCTLKQDMIDNGIPEEKIGLLYHADKTGLKFKPTAENDDRQFMLITHQRIRANAANLRQYNQYKGQPRNLLIYDESLLTSDVSHFEFTALMEAFAAILERTKRNLEEHASIHNYVTECKALMEAHFDNYLTDVAEYIEQPYLDSRVAERYAEEWKKDTTISNFLRLANTNLRMVKSGKAAIVTYRIVMPEQLKNVVFLDASFPIRKLVHYDKSIKNAETLPDCVKMGVKFHEFKKYDQVDLYRLRSYGGRNSMDRGFRGDRNIVKEVVKVVQTIPQDEAVLLFVYRLQQKGETNYARILLNELHSAGVDISARLPTGQDRIVVQTWGNETSLNCYSYCQHVFLVGILHRDDTELMASYFGQVNDLKAAIDKTITRDLSLSERAHLAYQALSRGTCRLNQNDQARQMKGYVVEIDPEIETSLSEVMPGATWHVWKPFFVQETDTVLSQWKGLVEKYLTGLPTDVGRVSSQVLKRSIQGADRVAPMSWTRILRAISGQELKHHSSKDHMDHGVCLWRLEDRSLVRVTAESFGFN
jgi:hypothetical protein